MSTAIGYSATDVADDAVGMPARADALVATLDANLAEVLATFMGEDNVGTVTASKPVVVVPADTNTPAVAPTRSSLAIPVMGCELPRVVRIVKIN